VTSDEKHTDTPTPDGNPNYMNSAVTIITGTDSILRKFKWSPDSVEKSARDKPRSDKAEQDNEESGCEQTLRKHNYGRIRKLIHKMLSDICILKVAPIRCLN
jgi:hypothetical protein